MPKALPKYGQLTQFLINQGVLEDPLLVKAFNLVDRRDFLPESQKNFYLENRPLPIGFDQTNSQPFTVAFMLELLLPRADDIVLDVGSGSGWTAALIAATGAKVTGVELIPGLVNFANNNLSKYNFAGAVVKNSSKHLGWIDGAPYTKIIVSAATGKLPDELLGQLQEGGRMVIPVNESILVAEKTRSGLKTHEFKGFRFVPLVH